MKVERDKREKVRIHFLFSQDKMAQAPSAFAGRLGMRLA
jgi:hypothetical protein